MVYVFKGTVYFNYTTTATDRENNCVNYVDRYRSRHGKECGENRICMTKNELYSCKDEEAERKRKLESVSPYSSYQQIFDFDKLP